MSGGGAEAIVIVEDLVVSYGASPAVRGISFAASRGEHITLLGPSGCGKTTTLRAIAGLEAPLSGRITIGGTVVFDGATGRAAPPERRNLSMVFQSYAIWPHMTVYDNAAFGFRARRIRGPRVREAVGRSLDLVGLGAFATRPASQLSGGQQQRVALARAIAFGSEVVLFDEPLSNLDAQLRLAMRSELKELQRRINFTAIYVTHDQEEALALSDRVILMRDGVIEHQGTPAEVYERPRTRFVAEFLNVRNVFPCEARSSETGPVAVLPNGIELPTRADPLPPARPCAVCFRPKRVRLAAQSPPGTAAHSGLLARVLYLGDVAHCFIASNGVEICAYSEPGPDLREGQSVFWWVDPEHCFLVAG